MDIEEKGLRTGPELDSCLADLMNSKEATVAGGQSAKEGRRGERG